MHHICMYLCVYKTCSITSTRKKSHLLECDEIGPNGREGFDDFRVYRERRERNGKFLRESERGCRYGEFSFLTVKWDLIFLPQ